jgi:cytochrome P450
LTFRLHSEVLSFPRLFANRLIQNVTSQIQAILDGKKDDSRMADHPTIFHELLDSSLPPAEKSLNRLVDEGETVVAAGTITTQHVLKATSFHLLANPDMLRKLKAELISAMPYPENLASLQQLERLPYLSAVVSEGLRISHPISSRLSRVSPDGPLILGKWEIPPGTPVSMTSIFVHENPKIFPEPREFRPDRWLQGNSKERLDRYLVPFSKGTRACLGINLAYAELYLTLAAVFRQFDLELYETTREDIEVVHDFFNPSARLDSKGVRVLVK